MTKTYGFWKRLGALLLALSLVVSMCPVKASAAGTNDLIPLELELYRVDQIAEWNARKGGDNGRWNEDLLGTFDENNAPTLQYIYIAKVPKVTNKSQILFYWCQDTAAVGATDENGKVIYDGTAVAENDKFASSVGEGFVRTSIQSNELKGVGMKIICDGLVLTNALPTSETKTSQKWTGYTENWNGELKYGVPVELGKFVLDGVSGFESGDLAPIDDYNKTHIKVEDGKYVPFAVKTDAKVNLFTRSIKAGREGGVVRFEEKLEGTVTYPKYEPIFKVAGTEYKSGSKVYLNQDNHDMSIYVSNKTIGAVKMPEVQGVEWVLDTQQNMWIGKMVSAKTVTIGNEKIEIVTDTQAPEINDISAYMDGETATVKFKVTSASGLKNLKVNNSDVPVKEDGIYVVSGLAVTAGSSINIEATSNAGLTGKASATVADTLHFVTAETNFEVVHTAGGVHYAAGKEGALRITLMGATETGSPSVSSVSGENVSGQYDEKGNWYIVYNFGADGTMRIPAITAQDSENRTAKYEAATYKLDTTAPVITVSEHARLNQNDTTVTFTVTDDVKMADLTGEHVAFTVNGVECTADFEMVNDQTWQASYVLKDQQKLTHIHRATISDAAGNSTEAFEKTMDVIVDRQAPNVAINFSDNVEGIYKSTQDGKIYLKLKNKVTDDAAEKDEEKETVVMSWTYNDFTDGEKSGQISMPVSKHQTAVLNYEIPAQDELGNVAATVDVIVGDTTQKLTAVKKDDGVSYFMGALHADRRIPGSSAESNIPKVSFKLDEHPAGRLDDQDVYATNFNVQAFISDISETPDADSGMYSVSWAVEGSDKLAIEGVPTGENGLAADGQYDFTVAIKNGDAVEVKDVMLKVTVKDNAGNEFTHTSQKFAVDNCAPRVTVGKAGEGNYVDGVEYIKSVMKYKVIVEDMFLAESAVAIKNGVKDVTVTENSKTDSEHTYIVSVAGDLKAEDITITAKDKAEHNQFNEGAAVGGDFKFENGTYVNKNNVIFDDVAPVVLVTRDNEPINAANGVDYHTGPVTYSFTVTDAHLTHTEDTTATLKISYTLDGSETTEVKLPVTVDSDKLLWDNATGKDVYTYSFTLADETKTLTDMKIEVNDNAGNVHVMDAAANCLSFEKGIYTGNDAIVDMTAPKVTVERTGTAVNKTDDYGYFDEDVKYTITVEEANFDPDSKVILSGKNLKNTELSFQDQKVEFTLTDTMQLDDMQIAVIDYAKHKPATINENVDDEAYQGSGDYQWTAESKSVIVDQTAPTATLTITSTQDVLDKYFTHTKDGVEYYYLKLTDPTGNTKENVTITATLTVKDRNLLNEKDFLVNNASSSANKHEGWDLTGIMVNDDACVATYSTKVEVPYDSTGLVKLDLAVKDAVNKPVDADITVDSVNNTTLVGKKPFQISGDKINSTIIMDRRRPTSDVESIPEIKIVPVTGTTLKLANNTELYNFNPSFYVNVQDGMAGTEDILHAGLSSVNISMENAGPTRGQVLSFAGVKKNYTESGVYQFEQTLALDGGEGECNDYNLTVVAEDNVGNVITVARKFAVDTMAPQVTVEYDNNQVLNDFYFRDDRIATITVEDINFSGADTKINTQVTPSAWVKGDDRITNTATCVYDTDGDYTFAMSSKDLAGNETGDDQVKYDGAAPKKFTVDKTNPVITVSFSPKHTNEFGGRWYYADLTTATVTIDEHNFRASDVAPVFRLAGNVINYVKLGDFTSTGDTHKANAAFSDGNDYDFTITYSDLAGNPAIPYNTDPHFSVDSKDPKIAMTRGDMTADGVNVVSGDIDLQFRITDEEKNLAGYTVKLTHLNNEFETYVITEKDNYRDWFSVDKQDDENTIYVTMANLPKEKEYDGIYTIEITGIDHAGNKTVMDVITYSLNRFGSTFTTDDDYTKQFLKLGADGITYHNSVDNKLIVKEINPNEVFHTVENKTVRGSMLTVVANGVSRQLVEGKDYTMTVVPDHKETGDKVETWYIYTYEIDPSVFQDENGFISGRYAILFYSEDAAGNKNTNEANISSTVQENANGEYTGKMEFVLDTMPPVITTTGIESNKVYNAEFQRMEILISDTTPTGIQVFLNGTEVALSDAALADTAAWLVLDELTGVYTLNVPEQNELFGSQYVSVIAKDAAGNAAEALVEDFNVSTSLLVRVVHSGWIIVGGGLGIAALIFLLIQWKKKKV